MYVYIHRHTHVRRANAKVTKPLILGLSPELLSRKSHGAPSGKNCCSRSESAMAHMTANTARIERLITLEFAISTYIILQSKTTYTWGFICLSTLLRLLGVPPEFKTILESKPVKRTTPITHFVFRKTVPRRRVMERSTGEVWLSMMTLPLSLYMLVSGRSHWIWNELSEFAQACASRNVLRDKTAWRDFRFVSPSRFIVSTKATSSSSDVAQMRISAGIDSLSMILIKSPTRKSSQEVLIQWGPSIRCFSEAS